MADADDPTNDIAAVLAGDRDRFRALVERYERPVFAVVRSFVRDEGRVEDLAQETFLAAYTHLASFDRSRGRFATWLYMIARNKCRDALRKNLVEVRPVVDEPLAEARSAPGSDAITRMLDVLPTDQRVAFLLGDVFELPYAEVAEIEDVPVGTIKSRVSRARERLRAALAPMKEAR